MSKATALLILFCLVSITASATLISYWDFNTGVSGLSQPWPKPLYSSYPGSLTYNYPAAISNHGITTNSIDGSLGWSFHIGIPDQSTYNGNYIELSITTAGFRNLSMSFAYYKNGNAFTTGSISYSTDGQNYTQFGNINFTDTGWLARLVDLSSITEIENKPSVIIRLTTTGAAPNGTKSFRFDNIQINADPITLPVEFSGMTVNPGTDNNAYITWTTQSETGVSGYYVLRGISEDLNLAEIISPLIPAANSSTTQTYFFADDGILVSGTYYYWLQALDHNGETGWFGPQILIWSPGDHANPSPPLKTGLKSLYPNPFNPSLSIAYALEEAAPVQIRIYNLRGQTIRSMDLGVRNAGEHRWIWNGTSDGGDACPSGVYRIVLRAGKVTDSRKVVLLK